MRSGTIRDSRSPSVAFDGDGDHHNRHEEDRCHEPTPLGEQVEDANRRNIGGGQSHVVGWSIGGSGKHLAGPLIGGAILSHGNRHSQ